MQVPRSHGLYETVLDFLYPRYSLVENLLEIIDYAVMRVGLAPLAGVDFAWDRGCRLEAGGWRAKPQTSVSPK